MGCSNTTHLIAALLLAALTNVGADEAVVRHEGGTDPRTEGFSFADGLPTGSVGTVTDDHGGHDAVFIDDNGQGESNYVFDLGATATLRRKVHRGRFNGWVLRTRLRVAEADDNLDTGVRVEFSDGETRWQLRFGSDETGRPVVGLGQHGSEPLARSLVDDPDGGYHLYELRFDPKRQAADLRVDGVKRLTDYKGFPVGSLQVRFGSNNSPTGHGRYSLVALEIAPGSIPKDVEREPMAGMEGPPDFLVEPGPGLRNYAGGKDTYFVPIIVAGVTDFPALGVPVRCGLPLPLGLLDDESHVRLLDEDGKPVELQTQPTGYWHDGSLKWLLLDFLATRREYRAEVGPYVLPTRVPTLRAEEDAEQITLTTGPLKLVVSKKRFTLPGVVWIDRNGDGEFTDDEKVTEGGDAFVRLRDDNGELTGTLSAARAGSFDVRLEAAGPVRATVRLSGRYRNEAGVATDYWVFRLHVYCGRPWVRIDHTFTNAVDVRRVHTMAWGVEIPVEGLAKGQVTIGVDGDRITVPCGGRRIGVRQINAEPKAFPRFDQFRPECRIMADGEISRTGERAAGWLSVHRGVGAVGVGLRDMVERYPAELQVDARAGVIRAYFQPDTGEPLDWFGGIDPAQIAPTGAKWQAFGDDGIALSEELILCFDAGAGEAQAAVSAFCAIPNAYADPGWLEATKAAGCVAARDPKAFPEAERHIERVLEWLYRHQNEWFHWYGKVDYGGVQTHYQPKLGHWSNLTERYGWLNGEDTIEAAAALHYLRSGSRDAFKLMRSTVKHRVDVDQVRLGGRRGYGRRHFALHWGQPGDWAHTFLFGHALWYHATGDGRVWDAMQETADLVRRSGATGGVTRDTHNQMRCALWLYEVTADATYAQIAARIMAGTLKQQDAYGHFGLSKGGGHLHTNIYLLWAMSLYDRLIGSKRVREALTRQMGAQITPFGYDWHPNGSDYTRHQVWEGLAHAYLATQDKRYLWPGLRDLTTMAYCRHYERYTPILRFPRSVPYYRLGSAGDVARDTMVGMHDFGRKMAKLPYFLYAAKHACAGDYARRIDTSLEGTFDPWAAPPGRTERRRFQPVSIDAVANTAPLTDDPFGYRDSDEAKSHYLHGPLSEKLTGLPWGATVFYDGVPFGLAKAVGRSTPAVICPSGSESVVIPVDRRADRLHFLGQVLTHGDFEYGRRVGRYTIEYADGERETILWENLVNCEDWRRRHYSLKASLAQSWPPKAFDKTPKGNQGFLRQLRHLNTLAVDTHGKPVSRVVFDAQAGNWGPLLAALTVEAPEPDDAPEPVLAVRFGTSERGPDTGEVTVTGKLREGEQFLTSLPDAGACEVRAALPPGQYEVDLLMDASHPLAMTIHAEGGAVVSEWHLLGEWQGQAHAQRIAFDVTTTGDRLSLGFQASRGHELYEGDGYGAWAWGLGWNWDSARRRWVGPTSDEFRTTFAPVWRLHEMAFYRVDK